MNVDRDIRLAEFFVGGQARGALLTLNPVANVVLHAMNLYGLLGTNAQSYELRSDPASIAAVDPEIRRQLAGQERYFGDGTLEIFSPTMERLVSDRIYRASPSPGLLRDLAPAPFGDVLARAWVGHYEHYWEAQFEGLVSRFGAMVTRFDWHSALDQMEHLTAYAWSGEMLVMCVEATAESAFTCGDRVCIGTLREGSDAGFVHEGLHLLLRGHWAESNRIRQLARDRLPPHPFWRTDWQTRYEQALVVGLDCHIRAIPQARVRQYFEGCGVGDLYGATWPLVSEHVQAPRKDIEGLMYDLIASSL